MATNDNNPFADPVNNSPFTDDSVQRAKNENRQKINEFNPFADENIKTTTTTVAPPKPATNIQQPAIMRPTEQPPPYTKTSAQEATDDLRKRQEELEIKAKEIERREQELRNMQSGQKKNNFPPLPEKCCVAPCFYQDISVDIPVEFQKIVRIGYYLWLMYIFCLGINIIGTLSALAALGSTNSHGQSFGLSILYFVLFTPCSFVCWFRPLYKAFRSDSSFNFFFFFFIFFFQFCISVFQAIGIPGYGTCGLYVGIKSFQEDDTKGKGVAVFRMLIGCLFVILSVVQFLYLVKVHRIYRRTGASFAKAQEELAQNVMSNKTVQTTAASAAQSAVQHQFGSPNNRY